MLHPGSCFKANYPTHEHLHIVVCDVTESTVTVVFVSSVKDGKEYDPACVVHKGEHPYISHDSYIVYDKFQYCEKTELERRLTMGEYIVEPDVSDDLLERIKNGARNSDYLSEFDKETFFRF